MPRWLLLHAPVMALALGCGSPVGSTDAADAMAPMDAMDVDSPPAPSCGGGSSCATPPCPMQSTTVSGTVYDPGSLHPIYGVSVYVPMATPLLALPAGPRCSCSSLYPVQVAVAMTDAKGHFSIQGVPAGANVPLVVQLGKWRMQYVIRNVVACQDNPMADRSLRLPRNHMEGDMPNIAISTGADDTLECLLTRIGIDAAEYTGGPGGSGRIHVFAASGGAAVAGGSGTTPDPATALWSSDGAIAPYDAVLLGCEGAETSGMNQQVLLDYALAGGRVFASHFHYSWFNAGPFATAFSTPLATWTPGAQPLGPISADVVTTLPNGAPFSAGQIMGAWLGNVGALIDGGLPIARGFHNVDVGAASSGSHAVLQVEGDAGTPGATQYLSFDVPPTGDACGRVIYSELHDTFGPGQGPNPDFPDAGGAGVVPDGCAVHPPTPEDLALEFMLFDLSSCPVPGSSRPNPPGAM